MQRKTQCARFTTDAIARLPCMTRMGSPGNMATPEREVGLALHDRFDEPGVVIHRVLTVCVLDEDDLARDMTKTLADRVPLALGLVLQNEQDGWILGVLAARSLACHRSSCSRRGSIPLRRQEGRRPVPGRWSRRRWPPRCADRHDDAERQRTRRSCSKTRTRDGRGRFHPALRGGLMGAHWVRTVPFGGPRPGVERRLANEIAVRKTTTEANGAIEMPKRRMTLPSPQAPLSARVDAADPPASPSSPSERLCPRRLHLMRGRRIAADRGVPRSRRRAERRGRRWATARSPRSVADVRIAAGCGARRRPPPRCRLRPDRGHQPAYVGGGSFRD